MSRRLSEVIDHSGRLDRNDKPQFEPRFETRAKLLGGFVTIFRHCEESARTQQWSVCRPPRLQYQRLALRCQTAKGTVPQGESPTGPAPTIATVAPGCIFAVE